MSDFAHTNGSGQLALSVGNICHVWQIVSGDEGTFRQAAKDFGPNAQVQIDRRGNACHITVTVGDQTVSAAVAA